MGKAVVFLLAIIGALTIFSGLLSVGVRKVSGEADERMYSSPLPRRAYIEVKVPRLNWKAADQTLAKFLDGIAPCPPLPREPRREETYAEAAMRRDYQEQMRQWQLQREQQLYYSPPQPICIW